MEDAIKEKAKINQQSHGGTAPGKTLNLNSEKVNTDKELARVAGVSADSILNRKMTNINN